MITDYTSLKATVVAYMKRQDLDVEVETFIQLAEGSLNNNPEFRVREMSHSTTYISKDGLVPFYDNYLSLRSIRNTGGNALSLASPAVMAQSDGCSTCPRFYREEGRQLHISPVVDYVSLDITYYKKIPALSDINTTNWLLQQAPNIYLYGALIESTSLVMNDERIGFWKSRYDEAVQQLINADQADRWSGSPASVRLHDESTSCITDEDAYAAPGELPGAPEFIALIPDQISDLNIMYTHDTSQYFSGEVTGYALYDAPTWLTMDAATGVMSGVPNAEALLTGLTVSASNEYGTVISNTFGMRVLAEPTGPPRFDVDLNYLLVDAHVNVNVPFQYHMSRHFRTGGAVAAYSLNNAPSWMSIDSVTGLINGTPLATEATTTVSVTATNTVGDDTTSTFVVETLDQIIPGGIWRLQIYKVNRSDGDYERAIHRHIAEIGFMATQGGNTITLASGGNIQASSEYAGARGKENAFRQRTNVDIYSWHGNFALGQIDPYTWIQYTFPGDVSIEEVALAVPSDASSQHTAMHYAIQYSVDSGTTFKTILGVVANTPLSSTPRYANLIEH